MISRITASAYVTVASALFVTGCVAQIPDDVTLVSVDLVKKSEQMEFTEQETAPYESLLGKDFALKPDRPTEGADHLLKVEFTSTVDLVNFARENSSNLGVVAYLCDRPNELVLMADPFVYWHGQRLGPLAFRRPLQERNTRKAQITYHAFLDLEGREMASYDRGNPYRAFDLVRDPHDVCLQLAGGSGTGFGYKSNTVVIPKAAIEAELSDLSSKG